MNNDFVKAAVAATALLAAPLAHASFPFAFDGNGAEAVTHTVTAANGDVYVAGVFDHSFTVQVGGTTRTLTRYGTSDNWDIFVARLNAAGQIVWIGRLGGAQEDRPTALAVDADGNAFVAGSFRDSAEFGGVALTAVGAHDGFVAKFTAAGGANGTASVEWARRFGSTTPADTSERDTPAALVALPRRAGELSSSVAVIGDSACNATFTGGAAPLNGLKRTDNDAVCSGFDVFVARISGSGDWQWAYTRPGEAHSAWLEVAGGNENGRGYLVVDDRTPAALETVFEEHFSTLGDSELSGSNAWGSNFTLSQSSNGVWPKYRIRDYTTASSAGGAHKFGQLDYNNSATTRVIDTRNTSEIVVNLHVLTGANADDHSASGYWLDAPDQEDHLVIEYLGSDGQWRTLGAPEGGRPNFTIYGYYAGEGPGPVIARDYAAHAGFKLRLRAEKAGSQTMEGWNPQVTDSWIVDDIRIQVRPDPMERQYTLLGVASLSDAKPVFVGAPQALPTGIDPAQVVVDPSGPIYIGANVLGSGAPFPNGTYCPGTNQAHGATVLKLTSGGSVCEWARGFPSAGLSNAMSVVTFDGIQVWRDGPIGGTPTPVIAGWTDTGVGTDTDAGAINGGTLIFGNGVNLTAASGTRYFEMDESSLDASGASQVYVTYQSKCPAAYAHTYGITGPNDSPVNITINPPTDDDQLRLYYLNNLGEWVLAKTTRPGDVSCGVTPAVVTSHAVFLGLDALHSGLKLRFQNVAASDASGASTGWRHAWSLDNIRVQWRSEAGKSSVTGLALGSDGVFLAGTFQGLFNVWNWSNNTGIGAIYSNGYPGAPTWDMFVAKIDADGVPQWLTGGKDYDTDGMPDYIGGPVDAGPGQPSYSEESGPIAVSAAGTDLYVGGKYRSGFRVGPDTLTAAGSGGVSPNSGVVFNLRSDGRTYRNEIWTVGVALTPPQGAAVNDAAAVPDFFVGGVPFDALGSRTLLWIAPQGSTPAELVPLKDQNNLEVRWRKAGEPLTSNARIATRGNVGWPTQACSASVTTACYQVHIVGAPVEINSAGSGYVLQQVINPDSNLSAATLDGTVLNTGQRGYATLLYGAQESGTAPYRIVPLRSVGYRDDLDLSTPAERASADPFLDDAIAAVGRKLTDAEHTEPSRAGYVINELSYHDATATTYNRAARTGTIVPVNVRGTNRNLGGVRELAVAWYTPGVLGVYWPSKAVRYEVRWPDAPGVPAGTPAPHLIPIASQQGSEYNGQPQLTAALYPGGGLYVQNNPALPGFNPNDEHAFMAGSNTGSGLQALFALRSDFGAGLVSTGNPIGEPNAMSDPYVLYRYYDPSTSEPKFLVYKVVPTAPGFTSFTFTGAAGTTVSPPYPVRLLTNCAESFVIGEVANLPPPEPFFRDYKNQLWAKSAGSGAARYYYPVRQDFFTDTDNDAVNDTLPDSGCIAWLGRLDKSNFGGGTVGEPVKVSYVIDWPASTPLLVSGETLLTPKRGLPEILNQAAVEIVYDQVQKTTPNAQPDDTAAQLVNALDARIVTLASLPSDIASSQRSDGWRSITGSADGTKKLPVSVRQRIAFDPQNHRLVLSGVYDAAFSAGEPLLLLNVLSGRDRDALQAISNDSAWNAAVASLWRTSRNPQGIARVCETANTNCTTVNDAYLAGHVLAAYQDALPAGSPDGVLEPLRTLGGSPALTAGFSKGSGYLTLAFNNHAALNPAPVSLSVIRVGCLDGVAAGTASSYQGQIHVLAPDDIFDEQLVLRHSGDFGGNPDALQFEWYYAYPQPDGSAPPLPDPDGGILGAWFPIPGSGAGANETTIAGADIRTLSDNWYLARYKGLPQCGNGANYSLFAGAPGGSASGVSPQLAEGWVKRVLNRLNPFETRVRDFANAPTNTYVSMLVQLGQRYSGPIALNSDAGYINSVGLIEAYTTVMRRAMALSVDSTPPVDFDPANNAILLVASRLAQFYALLGNEAYADAQDPTVSIGTDGLALSPSIFNFQNQLDSSMTEELVLLRGRDATQGTISASPVYNRLFWNFTNGDGEAAYANSYLIYDQVADGVLDENDARAMYPQGHGDAWGHYLTASTLYYDLLRHPFFTWIPRAESVLVAGTPIPVDYEDERQFAKIAAAKARAGAEIVNLTYRASYLEDPAGQYQGYEDADAQRAWGLAEWGRRTGQAAYFDWVTLNSILPSEDPDPDHHGIQRIERAGITQLDEIATGYADAQGQVDKADAGLNPLGLAKGVVPFDIDPSQLEQSNKTQFEQVYDRALTALKNAGTVWDHARQLNNQLRRSQKTAADFSKASTAQETDFANRLIEIFGYPYSDDIGAGKTYAQGYDGPDLFHYMYSDRAPEIELANNDSGNTVTRVERIERFTGTYSEGPNGLRYTEISPTNTLAGRRAADGTLCSDAPLAQGCPLGDAAEPEDSSKLVEFVVLTTPDGGTWFVKPPEWTGSRRAPGRLQQITQQMIAARIALARSQLEYEKLRQDIEAKADIYSATYNTYAANIGIIDEANDQRTAITAAIGAMKAGMVIARLTVKLFDDSAKAAKECIPSSTVIGLANGGDIYSGVKCALDNARIAASSSMTTANEVVNGVVNVMEGVKASIDRTAQQEIQQNQWGLALYNIEGEIEALIRQEPLARVEMLQRSQVLYQLAGEYQAALAEGLRTLDELKSFRRDTAAEVQAVRYQDMAFRIFRNDALQKYRAAFDLAARYVYLAASAYDYETNLAGSNAQAGQTFLTSVVRERSIGQLSNGVPLPGSPGLADTMARLSANFAVLKGQMGFNNPQVETNRFSLRRELLRIPDGPEGDAAWRMALKSARVENLWAVPEFRRYARPFAPESAGPQPGLVIEFDSSVVSGLNFFGWELGPNDSSYDSSQFATRIRSVGAWFAGYAGLPLADDPRVYLFPVGADVLRAPGANDFATREWQVVDQAIPVPFQIGSSQVNNYAWNPLQSLNGAATELRRYARFRAYNYAEPFNDGEVISDSRLVGRSVWNRKWVLIIPGETLLNDADAGLDAFIDGRTIPGSGERDGDGVDDIHIFFKTYAYSGQ